MADMQQKGFATTKIELSAILKTLYNPNILYKT